MVTERRKWHSLLARVVVLYPQDHVVNAVFDSTLGRHGGTRFRGSGGRFVTNPNRGKPWYCQKSPTGAHHWFMTTREGQCKYCGAECRVSFEPPKRFLAKKRQPQPLIQALAHDKLTANDL